ncbi:TetR/AcrR family transcriptional regulator [Caldisalinibacter kiritimatiensis]|uniref:Transcriptional regulator, TetR family n=1 Tax=Caldisalinibacter kiritimatiensis TaxID=1304284 RepID=R1CE44_9FIRM|nr:TetR/AcrR family transcriptional regulator [Caldisalinibacter kiritimatiensis]EOD00545.1 transcriptional regulator, TetR family [Caldisalinibacter kiritimatiensis]
MVRISKKPEERKKELLNIAEKLFLKQGFDDTSINQIVKEAKVAKGTFYYYFKSKDEILSSILKRYIDNIEKEIKKISNEKSDAHSKMENIFKKLFYTQIEDNRFTQQFKSDTGYKIKAKLDKAFFNKFQPIILNVIKQGIEEKVFNTSYPQRISEILLLGIQGYMHNHYLYTADKQTYNSNIKAMEELLTRTLQAKYKFNLTV